MPNRILKESICVSDSIDGLSWFEEVLFYRLIVNCDDYGRFDGRIAVIKNRLFPLKENLTLKAVSGAINKLVNAGLVTLYVFEGKPYLYLPTWNDHQSVRAKRSKYPKPSADDGNVKSSEIICNHVNANVTVIQSNSISESESESNSIFAESGTDSAAGCAFERFWACYPKKVGKQAAERAFAKARKKCNVDRMIAAIEKQKQSRQWQKDNGDFIPNPTTWLNQGRWEDVLEESHTEEQAVDDCGFAMGNEELEAIARLKRLRDSKAQAI